MRKSAFTLSEVLVVLCLLGTLAAILIPVINNAQPNKVKTMFKKAYFDAEKVIDLMISDEDIYPTMSRSVSGATSNDIGFLNTAEVYYNGEAFSGASKFCKLFAKHLNITNYTDYCNGTMNSTTITKPSFITGNGVRWYVNNNTFNTSGLTGETTIYVDVIPSGHMSTNCAYSSSCTRPDTFGLKIDNLGRMSFIDDKAKEYMKTMKFTN